MRVVVISARIGRARLREHIATGLLQDDSRAPLAQLVKRHHVQVLPYGHYPFHPVGQWSVVAEEERSKTLRRGVLRLLHREDGLPGPRASTDGGPDVRPDRPEEPRLLRGQAYASFLLVAQP